MDYGLVDASRTLMDRARAQTTGNPSPVNHEVDYRYDTRFGRPKRIAKSGGTTLNVAYDDFGRILKTWTPLDSEALPTTCYFYYLATRPAIVATYRRESSGVGEACGTDGMVESASFFDGLGRLIESKEESSEPGFLSAVVEAATFDAEGRTASSKDPFFSSGGVLAYDPPSASIQATTYQYDEIGRQTVVTFPGVPPVVTSYTGWTVVKRDAENRKTETDLDGFGREVRRRTYDDGGLVYSTSALRYDRQGRLESIVDSAGNIWRYGYNALGEQITAADPDAGSSSREYYKDGMLKRLVDAENRPTTYSYDELDRLVQENRLDGSVVAYRYDEPAGGPGASGRLTSVEDSSTGIRREYEYDLAGRLIRSRERIDGLWYEVSASLDPLGRVRRLTYPDNSYVDYQYGFDGRVSSIPGFVTSARYTAWGGLASLQYSNGVSIDNTYDPVTRRLSRKQAVSLSGARLVDSTFDYTPAGYLRGITDAVGTGSQTFQLDHQYRLVGATGSYGVLSYTYDPLGNLLSKEGVQFNYGGAGPHQPISASNGLSFTYDPRGDLKSALRGQVGKSYDYNLDGQLWHVVDTERNRESFYTYGPDGRRVKRVDSEAGGPSTTTIFISDLFQEEQGGNRKFVYLGALRIGEVRGAAQKYFYVTDQVGSLNVVTDGAGALVQRLEYKPYGEISSVQGDGVSVDFAYAGARKDDATGLYDFGARFYDPSLGRFLTVDPLLVGPIDPNNLSPYVYARNNPISLLDVGGYFYQLFFFHGCGDEGCFAVHDDSSARPEGFVGSGAPSPASPEISPYQFQTPTVYDVEEVPGLREATAATPYFVASTDAQGNPAAVLVDPQTGRGIPVSEIPGGYDYIRVPGTAPTLMEATGHFALDVTMGTAVFTLLNMLDAGTPLAELGIAAAAGGGALRGAASGALEGAATGAAGEAAALGQVFRSHSALSRALGRAGPGRHWHHIVEQTPGNIARFGPEAIHNSQNVVRLDAAFHARISGFYSSIQPQVTGSTTLTVRQWLSTQSFQAQQAFGQQLLRQFGGP